MDEVISNCDPETSAKVVSQSSYGKAIVPRFRLWGSSNTGGNLVIELHSLYIAGNPLKPMCFTEGKCWIKVMMCSFGIILTSGDY